MSLTSPVAARHLRALGRPSAQSVSNVVSAQYSTRKTNGPTNGLFHPKKHAVYPKWRESLEATRTASPGAIRTASPKATRTASPNPSPRARFTADDIPPPRFWEQIIGAWMPDDPDLDPDRCHAAMVEYVGRARADKPDWRAKLIRDGSPLLNPRLLHCCAAMTMMGPVTPAWHIGLHVFDALVSVAYAPSILSSVRLAMRARKLGHPRFLPAEAAFADLMATPHGRADPDACTLHGMLLAGQGSAAAEREALKWFERAEAAAAAADGSDAPTGLRWEWEPSCFMEMGKLYLREGLTARARRAFRHAAEKLDLAEACWLYTTVAPPGDPLRETMLLRAAYHGIKPACEEMAAREGARIAQGGLKGWDKDAAEFIKGEWEAIAAHGMTS